jgi:ribosomal protein S18
MEKKTRYCSNNFSYANYQLNVWILEAFITSLLRYKIARTGSGENK